MVADSAHTGMRRVRQNIFVRYTEQDLSARASQLLNLLDSSAVTYTHQLPSYTGGDVTPTCAMDVVGEIAYQGFMLNSMMSPVTVSRASVHSREPPGKIGRRSATRANASPRETIARGAGVQSSKTSSVKGERTLSGSSASGSDGDEGKQTKKKPHPPQPLYAVDDAVCESHGRVASSLRHGSELVVYELAFRTAAAKRAQMRMYIENLAIARCLHLHPLAGAPIVGIIICPPARESTHLSETQMEIYVCFVPLAVEIEEFSPTVNYAMMYQGLFDPMVFARLTVFIHDEASLLLERIRNWDVRPDMCASEMCGVLFGSWSNVERNGPDQWVPTDGWPLWYATTAMVKKRKKRKQVVVRVGDYGFKYFHRGSKRCIGPNMTFMHKDMGATMLTSSDERGICVLKYNWAEGSHEPSVAGSFIKVIEHLNTVHAAEFVHVDIRGANILHNGETGMIIDFDLALKVGTPLEVELLNVSDGKRFAEKGHPVAYVHDWKALGFIMECYETESHSEPAARIEWMRLTNAVSECKEAELDFDTLELSLPNNTPLRKTDAAVEQRIS
eukprot:TRINITY_DN4147_c0_g1_i12.p1 TRINITY_DN4147_c0_g1~~TRINITY_DN4147_c0_g1_i12.p1  ORF type:complete len:559 (+),score=63.02 TRINITY_DN4147_c0_g1_i12:758-2434(+)